MIAVIGIDLVDIARVQKLMDAKGERALRRLFTGHEVTYALSRPNPAQHLAARLAAKEAAFKAFSGNSLARSIGWRDIEVVRGDSGPTLVFHGRAADRAAELGVTSVWVTLTHSALTAGAVVVLEALNGAAGAPVGRADEALSGDNGTIGEGANSAWDSD